jgi:dTDP-4-dehydrorhamnose 3,5-epimerase
LKIITKKISKYKDKRGYFSKIYSPKKSPIKNIKQINLSLTKKIGIIRGLHLQLGKFKETRIIKCIKGQIFDVVVDLRPSSKTYLKYKSKILKENEDLNIVVPKGFAHGFQTLKRNTKILYLHSNEYSKKNEMTIYPLDARINIKWPIKVINMSSKDKKGIRFNEM